MADEVDVFGLEAGFDAVSEVDVWDGDPPADDAAELSCAELEAGEPLP